MPKLKRFFDIAVAVISVALLMLDACQALPVTIELQMAQPALVFAPAA